MSFRRWLIQMVFSAQAVSGSKGNRLAYRMWSSRMFDYAYRKFPAVTRELKQELVN